MKRKIMILTAVCVSSGICSQTLAAEQVPVKADATAQEYSLETVNITAMRDRKRNVDIPADTETLTTDQLAATGANNLQEALKYTTGIVYLDYGPGGNSMGNMRSKLLMRGAEVLVMINGAPLNIRGSYNLSDIPISDVERIEIVRGGGSVLYGSDAIGGVINIITKKKRTNSVKTSFGNMGQQEHHISIQQGNLGIGYDYQKWGNVDNITSNNKNFNGSEKNNISLNYNINNDWSIFYNHNNSKMGYFTPLVSSRSANQTDHYDTTRDFFQINYQHKSLSGNFYYNERRHNSFTDNTILKKGKNTGRNNDISKEKNYNIGLDINKKWRVSTRDNILFGTAYQREKYSKTDLEQTNPFIGKSSSDYETTDASRDNYSAYGQWEHRFNDTDTVILSGRESWTANGPNDENYTNFSGQGQFIHKLNNNESIYMSIGQSFKMPTLNQSYNTLSGSHDLQPQKGTHYEIGWKKVQGAHNWQTSLFHYNIKNNITPTVGETKVTYSNEDIRNTGIEIMDIINSHNNWKYNWGIVYSNPENNPSGTNAMGKSLRGTWAQEYGKWQLNGGATYHGKKVTAGINAVYLFDRVNSPDNAEPTDCKPYLLTNFNVKYDFDATQSVYLTVNNILDRDDIVTHSASTPYYSTPINFMLGYELNF
ncbi:TonB-dependent receptor plug domain-containing protein [Pectinatus cerevisiiphilus]|uniref:Iron complex outermembrane receptor protein n=1 Tax=Pectinatus cerevisiiphilus TaxID=86956 RepID=A0A4R3KC75_9FIRM|nr:TonB-dependent receptor [Pectinatus cerevisiiphilus]TCS80563.1 iron complex outermembrane receptor protein [Pectinatus cerevisiiphilus]